MTRWYAPLVTRPVRRIMKQVGSSGPRAGLLAGLLLAVTCSYGREVDAPLLQAVATGLEAWSSVLFGRPPLPFIQRALDVRDSGLRSRARVLIESLEPPNWMPEQPVPEAVISLRLTIEAAVVLGQIPSKDATALHRVATWLGLWIEGPTIKEDAWEGAWTGLKPVGRGDMKSIWLELLHELPTSDLIEQLEALTPEQAGPRAFLFWRPHQVVAAGSTTPWAGEMAAWLGGEHVLADAARASNRGGKRLRSRLCLAVAAEIGRPHPGRAAAVEWIHEASLLVDDVMDASDVRRGRPSLHEATDVAFALSVAAWITIQVLVRSPVDERELLLETIEAMVRGQVQEWTLAERGGAGPDEIDEVITQKTAALFGAAAALGAPGVIGLAAFGEELGRAFQLVDDLLDVYGDAQTLGKQTGVDQRQGRVTWVNGRSPADVRSEAGERLESALQRLEAAVGSRPPPIVAVARAAVERDR